MAHVKIPPCNHQPVGCAAGLFQVYQRICITPPFRPRHFTSIGRITSPERRIKSTPRPLPLLRQNTDCRQSEASEFAQVKGQPYGAVCHHVLHQSAHKGGVLQHVRAGQTEEPGAPLRLARV